MQYKRTVGTSVTGRLVQCPANNAQPADQLFTIPGALCTVAMAYAHCHHRVCVLPPWCVRTVSMVCVPGCHGVCSADEVQQIFRIMITSWGLGHREAAVPLLCMACTKGLKDVVELLVNEGKVRADSGHSCDRSTDTHASSHACRPTMPGQDFYC